MNKQLAKLLLLLLATPLCLHAQMATPIPEVRASGLPGKEIFPDVALKTNLLTDLTGTLNLGVEFRLSAYLTMDLSANYNPWTFSDNRKLKHIQIQPELRYWVNEPFNGHFLGTHLSYTNFNVGNLNLPFDIFPDLKDYRLQGNGYGLGVSYGYQWLFSPRWSLEASLGFGYMYLDYTRYECHTCGKKLNKESKHYFGPTKLAVSLIYIIK